MAVRDSQRFLPPDKWDLRERERFFFIILQQVTLGNLKGVKIMGCKTIFLLYS